MPNRFETDSQFELAGTLRRVEIEGGFWALDLASASPEWGSRAVLVGADAAAAAAGDGASVVVTGAGVPSGADVLMSGPRFTVASLEVAR
jgi:hypothetical protein